jgi:hypothetical protein
LAKPSSPQALHDPHVVVQHFVSIEDEATGEVLPLEEQGQPEPVVGPHLGVGDTVDLRPERDRLDGLSRLAAAVGSSEDPDVDRVSVDELEAQLTALAGLQRGDADLFFDFAQRRLEGGFAVLDAATVRDRGACG